MGKSPRGAFHTASRPASPNIMFHAEAPSSFGLFSSRIVGLQFFSTYPLLRTSISFDPRQEARIPFVLPLHVTTTKPFFQGIFQRQEVLHSPLTPSVVRRPPLTFVYTHEGALLIRPKPWWLARSTRRTLMLVPPSTSPRLSFLRSFF